MRSRVFITQPIAASARKRLEAIATVTLNPDPLHIATKAELLNAARENDIIFCLLHDKVDAEVINANPKLKAIASMTITPADIDIAAATARKLPVTTIPSLLLDDATADIAWALLLAVARRVAEGDRLMRGGVFPGGQSCYLEGSTVSGKTIGMIGMGGVGRASARRAQGFGMQTLYYDLQRLVVTDEQKLGLTWTTLNALLARSDFVSIHARLTPQTRHLIGEREFNSMKPTAYLINSARGPIVDEQALVRALQTKRIAGAGLDVYENEPQPDAGLLKLPNVVFTPHVGSATVELRDAMANVVVDNILAILEGRRAPNCWNAEIYN